MSPTGKSHQQRQPGGLGVAKDDGGDMSPMDQPPTGEEAGTQNKTKDGTGGVPDRKAEVLGLLISPKFPPHFIVAQHFPSSSQGEFPISLPQNSSNQKASTSLAQIPGRNLFGERDLDFFPPAHVTCVHCCVPLSSA